MRYLIIRGWKDGDLNVAVPFTVKSGKIIIDESEILDLQNNGIELIKDEDGVKTFFSI